MTPAGAQAESRPKELLGSGDALAVACILLATLIVSLPAIRGDLAAYVDNPAHLSELNALALPGATGWSDGAFCGFPVSILHSPLLYGALARLVRLGMPLAPGFTAAAIASLAAPTLVFYGIARRRVAVPWALALASTLILYRGSLVGYTAALGGMFSFHLGAAALLLVMERLARPSRELRDVAILGALVAFVGLSHMYVTMALAQLAMIHGVASLLSPSRRRVLLFDIPAFVLGMVGAADYWLPNILSHTRAIGHPSPVGDALVRFLWVRIPLPPEGLSGLKHFLFDPILGLDRLLQGAVLVLALAGLRRLVRSGDELARYGALFAAWIVFGIVFEAVTKIWILAPQSFRCIYFLKLAVLVSVLPFVAHVTRERSGPRIVPMVAAAVLLFAVGMERVTATQAIDPAGAEMTDVHALWSWLRDHRTSAWGRVYLEDTFKVAPLAEDEKAAALRSSHILALTSDEAGVEQLGAYYGATPYASEPLVDGEFGRLFYLKPTAPGFAGEVAARMLRTYCTHVVVADGDIAARLASDGRFTSEHAVGRFTVLSLRESPRGWATARGGATNVSVERVAPGRMRLALDRPSAAGETLDVAELYHPFWRDDLAAPIAASPDGLMVVGPLPAGTRSFELTYQAPRSPFLLSLFGVGAILALFVADGVVRRSQGVRSS